MSSFCADGFFVVRILEHLSASSALWLVGTYLSVLQISLIIFFKIVMMTDSDDNILCPKLTNAVMVLVKAVVSM